MHEQRTADDAYYRSIYLIEGMAGSGKSYIVRTLTKMLPEVKVFETPFVRHLMTDSSPATVYQSLNLRLVTIDMYLGDVIDEVARHELARFHGKHVEASNHPLHACTITDMCQAMAPAVNRRKQAGEDVPVFNEETVRDTMRFTLENIEDYDRRTLAYGQQYETHPVLPTQATVFAIEQARKYARKLEHEIETYAQPKQQHAPAPVDGDDEFLVAFHRLFHDATINAASRFGRAIQRHLTRFVNRTPIEDDQTLTSIERSCKYIEEPEPLQLLLTPKHQFLLFLFKTITLHDSVTDLATTCIFFAAVVLAKYDTEDASRTLYDTLKPAQGSFIQFADEASLMKWQVGMLLQEAFRNARSIPERRPGHQHVNSELARS